MLAELPCPWPLCCQRSLGPRPGGRAWRVHTLGRATRATCSLLPPHRQKLCDGERLGTAVGHQSGCRPTIRPGQAGGRLAGSPPTPGCCPTSCSCIHRLGLMSVARGPRACSPSRFQEPEGLVCEGGSVSGPEQHPDPSDRLPSLSAIPRACPAETLPPQASGHLKPIPHRLQGQSGVGAGSEVRGQWGCGH